MVTTELRTACCNAYYTDWDGILVCRKCEARNPEIIEIDSDSMCNESGMAIEFGQPGVGKTNRSGVGKTNIERPHYEDEAVFIYVLDDGETWTLTKPTPVPVTAEQLTRIENDENVYDVVPDWDEHFVLGDPIPRSTRNAPDVVAIPEYDFVQAGIDARERLKKTAMESAQEYIDREVFQRFQLSARDAAALAQTMQLSAFNIPEEIMCRICDGEGGGLNGKCTACDGTGRMCEE